MNKHKLKAAEKLLETEYGALVEHEIAHQRVETRELDIFPRGHKMTKEQQADSIKNHLKILNNEARKLKKTIKAINKYISNLK